MIWCVVGKCLAVFDRTDETLVLGPMQNVVVGRLLCGKTWVGWLKGETGWSLGNGSFGIEILWEKSLGPARTGVMARVLH